VGNLAFHYLNIADSPAIRADPAATFLAWENGRFVDATAAVRSGARQVKFFNRRPPH
jgi:hypothetical protein